MKVEHIDTVEGLEAIAPAWRALFDRIPAATPFASPAWLIPWWRTFTPGRLASVAVWSGPHLVALAPLYVEHGAVRRLLPLGIGLSDYLDVLIDPAHAAEAGDAMTAAIGAGCAGWDTWSAEDAVEGAAVLGLATPDGCISTVVTQAAAPVLDLGDGVASVPAGKRRKWRMAQHRAARRESFLQVAEAAAVPDMLDQLVRLHAARWQSRGEAGVLADPRVVAFHRAAAPGLLEAGLLRLCSATIDGEVAGVYYGLQRGTAAYAYLGGFDPAFAHESPGTLLVGAAIADAAACGITAFHFLRGREAYKYEWGAVDRWTRCRRVEPCR